jgi:hypothetical protein
LFNKDGADTMHLKPRDSSLNLTSSRSITDLVKLVGANNKNSQSDYSYFEYDKLELNNLPEKLARIEKKAAAYQNEQRGSDSAAETPRSVTTRRAKNKSINPKQVFNLNMATRMEFAKHAKVNQRKHTYLSDKVIEDRNKQQQLKSLRADFDPKTFFHFFEKLQMVSQIQ